MATVSVRKFAISVDPNEIVDFAEKLEYFDVKFKELGFDQIGHYTFRYADQECMIKAELQSSKDGYYLWAYVQAEDEHIYRLQEMASAFGACVVDRSKVDRGPQTDRYTKPQTDRYTKPQTDRYTKPPQGGAAKTPQTDRYTKPPQTDRYTRGS